MSSGLKAAVLGLIVFLIYQVNFRVPMYFDPLANAYTALSLAKEGNFEISEYYEGKAFYFVVQSDENLYPLYPPATAVLASPFFLPLRGREFPETWEVQFYGKMAASAAVAAGVAFFYLIILRWGIRGKNAIFLSLVYGLCTSVWSVSSQALFQHPFSHLFILLGIWALTNRQRVVTAGCAFAAAIAVRPLNSLFWIGVLLYFLVRVRRTWPALLHFILAGLPFALAVSLYNYSCFGELWVTGYHDHLAGAYWNEPFWNGFKGLLLSPGRGLLIYSPFLIFALPGLVKTFQKEKIGLGVFLAIPVFAHILLLSKYKKWTGGASWSYRMLIDVVPVLMLYVASFWSVIKKYKTILIPFCLLLTWSFIIQFLGMSAFRCGPIASVDQWSRGTLHECLCTEPKLFHLGYKSGFFDDHENLRIIADRINEALSYLFRLTVKDIEPRRSWDSGKPSTPKHGPVNKRNSLGNPIRPKKPRF